MNSSPVTHPKRKWRPARSPTQDPQSDAPAGLDYLASIASRLDRPERLEAARERGRTNVAVVGVAVPEPLFWACGATPIFLGHLVGRVERDGEMPRDACALIRTSHELLAEKWIPAGLVDAVVVAAGCDWTTRLADRLGDAVPVWPLNISRLSERERESRAILQARVGSLEAMLESLEILTDLPLTRRAFAEACNRQVTLDALCECLDELRAESPQALSASDYYRIVGALDLANPDRWMEAVQTSLRMRTTSGSTAPPAIQNPKSKIQNPRIVLSGCPTGFPDPSIVRLIEQAGMQIAGDDFASHGRGGKGKPCPKGGRKAILRWVADTLSVGADGPDSPLAALIADREADGLIWLNYRGCAVSAMAISGGVGQRPRKQVSVLAVEVDQVGYGNEALLTRLEAFREQLLASRVA